MLQACDKHATCTFCFPVLYRCIGLTLPAGERIINNLEKLGLLIEQESETLLTRWRTELRKLDSAKNLDLPTLNDHIPILLKELSAAFKLSSNEGVADARASTPPEHGVQRFADGFEVEEVVSEYNILRNCIHDLATEKNLILQGKPFTILNVVLDKAIGAAVKTYAEQRAQEVQQKRAEYLSFVAHDLRTPLSAVSLATRVLEMSVTDPDEKLALKKILHTLNRNVRHLAGLVDKILDETIHLETDVGVKLERRVFDLWPLVENLIHDLHPVVGNGGTQLVNLVPHDLEVYADASLLQRIFQNLLANAIAYTTEGTVTLSARVLPDRSGIECCVTDTGTGIARDRVEKVFDKFEGDADSDSSTGLGLTIVKTFVEAHGGEIGIASEIGAGSVIRFTLPDKQN